MRSLDGAKSNLRCPSARDPFISVCDDSTLAQNNIACKPFGKVRIHECI